MLLICVYFCVRFGVESAFSRNMSHERADAAAIPMHRANNRKTNCVYFTFYFLNSIPIDTSRRFTEFMFIEIHHCFRHIASSIIDRILQRIAIFYINFLCVHAWSINISINISLRQHIAFCFYYTRIPSWTELCTCRTHTIFARVMIAEKLFIIRIYNVAIK